MLFHRQNEAKLIRSTGLALFAALAAYLGYKAYGVFIDESQEGVSTLAIVIAAVTLTLVSAVGFYIFYVHARSSDFFIDVDSETKKVSWPEWGKVKNSTFQVVIVMLVLTGYLFGVDLLLQEIRELVY